MKKIYALIALTATAVLSGVALSKFLNWAGQIEIFDFDLDEDILFFSRPFKGFCIGDTNYDPLRA